MNCSHDVYFEEYFFFLDDHLGRGFCTIYFWGKNLDHEIAIKVNLGRNWYLRTEYGQTGVSELCNVSIADSPNFLKMAKKTPWKRI